MFYQGEMVHFSLKNEALICKGVKFILKTNNVEWFFLLLIFFTLYKFKLYWVEVKTHLIRFDNKKENEVKKDWKINQNNTFGCSSVKGIFEIV